MFFKKEMHFYLKIITCDPRIIQWTIISVLNQTIRKNPLVHKGLISGIIIVLVDNCIPFIFLRKNGC